MPSRIALPNPAARLPGEGNFLAAVVASLADDTPKLVYADWLDDHDDTRGPFLREFVAALRSGDPLPPSAAFHKPWRDLVGVTLAELARANGFADRVSRFLGVAMPALATEVGDDLDEAVGGASRYGGRPELPPGLAWPARDSGKPLAFLAQLRLADLCGSIPGRDLPADGLFSVFYDLFDWDRDTDDYTGEARDGWQFFYFPDVTNLAPRDFPDGVGPNLRFLPYSLTFTEYLTLPPVFSPRGMELELGDDIPTLDRYANEVAGPQTWPAGRQRVLGYPDAQSWEPSLDRGVRHLVTVGPADPPGWLLGDGSDRDLRFLVPAEDLQNGRFDRVWHEAEWFG